MYKMLLPLLVLALSNWAFAAEDALYQKTFSLKEDGAPAERIVQTFRDATASKTANPVKTLVIQLKKDLEGTGRAGAVTKANLFQLYSGKGSATQYGSSYLVGVPVSMDGTGLIEEYGLLFEVRHNVDMATGKETVTIERQVQLAPVK